MSPSTIAANRFGYGLRANDRAPADPRRWLNDQMKSYNPRPAEFANVPTLNIVATSLAETRAELRMLRQDGEKGAAEMEARKEGRKEEQAYYMQFVGARMNAALNAPAPFVERLVHFWANHFAVSADKQAVNGLAGLLEIDAIRTHVLGNFGDMLLAVERHPAMLLYLDQAQSIGPASSVGTRIAERGRRKAGLNENFAREVLELHTLGVRTGYSQADVTEFARALTGWTVSGIARGAGARAMDVADSPGAFVFAGAVHEPGNRVIMGRSYAQPGVGQATAILRDLSVHPATAKHISTKLARHFAGDDPPAALVARLERRFTESKGDLKALYAVLVDAPEIWAMPQAKFKTPWDWIVSSARALGVAQVEPQWAANVLTQLGQPVWRSGSPAGFDDVAASWAGPDALYRRVEVAERLAVRFAATSDPRALAMQLFSTGLSESTAAAISRAESPVQGAALLLVSPEFLRR
jgi:uncharacterized protein (DUF1800 family)